MVDVIKVFNGVATLGSMNQALQDPLSFWTPEMRQNDIAVFKFMGRRFVVVFTPDLAAQVLQDKDNRFGRSEIANRMLVPAMGEGLLTLHGDQWKQHRKVVARAFRHEALCELIPGIHQSATDLVKRLNMADGKDVDILPEMMHTTFEIIQGMLFGKAIVHYDQDEVLNDVSSYLGTLGLLNIFDFMPVVSLFAGIRHMKGYAAARRFRNLTQDAVDVIRAQPVQEREPTLASMLIEAQEDGFENHHIIDNIVTFVGAGHETTSLALSWVLHLLLERPETWAALQDEVEAIPSEQRGTVDSLKQLDLHERVIKEAMRLYPPVPQVGRTVTDACCLGGVAVLPGDHITVAIEPIHQDPKYWDKPDQFNPDRFLQGAEGCHHRYQFLPFGGGQHTCVGMRLALWEAQIILSGLVANFDLALPKNPVLVEKSVRVTMRPSHGLPLRFIPKKQQAT
ncbi:cytochrome P450 [Amylibacter sp. SFDW26]|uniref:cytochrome P450 n=1 Tax=Amylibacter sp. SFDW26 TaxID=2652722 RepID=UPI00186A9981|nr:cytochrome P450 [Amylibacter sp. SFDW26]